MKIFSKLFFLSLLICGLTVLSVFGQTATPTPVAAGVQIENKAKIDYNDPDNQPVSGVSNTVTLVVDPVAGLEILPDNSGLTYTTATTSPIVSPFTINNLSNFDAPVTFGPNGAAVSMTCTGAASTISRAVIDVDNSGTINAGDIDIFTNGALVSYTVPNGASATVLVEYSTSATPGTCTLALGDTTGNAPSNDNVATDGSPGSVATDLTTPAAPVNGNVEARGLYNVTFEKVGAVLNGPINAPDATGSDATTGTDYSSKTSTSGNVVPCGDPTTGNALILFTNTVRNDGSIAENIHVQLFSAPAGFTVEFSTDGLTWTPVTAGGSFYFLGSLGAGQSINYQVRATAPAGIAVGGMYPIVVNAFSGLNADGSGTATGSNATTDRVYTGYVCAVKSQTVTNNTGIGGPTDAVPGAVITYTITATNVALAPAGTGNLDLPASNLVITEDGNLAPNNWGSTTSQVAGSATSSNGGTIAGDVAGSSLLTDTVTTLAPQAVEVFSFQRKIN